MNLHQLKVLYFNSIEIPKKSDIVWGLVELGTDVSYGETLVSLSGAPDNIVEAVVKELRNCDVAISQNFSVSLAKACHETHTPYISWIYDSPQTALFSGEAHFDENYIFVFDKRQVEMLRSMGLRNVFYRPLAANMMYVQNINITDTEIQKYKSDISFIGQLYNVNSYDRVFESLSDNDKKIVESIISDFSCRWQTGKKISGALSSDFVEENENTILNSEHDYLKNQGRLLLETVLLGYGIAREERKDVFSFIGNKHDFALYTKDTDMDIAKKYMPVEKVHGYVRDEEPYKIYYSSKINLNLTLRSIETGVPQRIFDIMATGGVVASNYQDEIEELFVPDKEIVVFHSIEELDEKITYLLSHEEERMQIGINGYNRVKNEFTYSHALMDMFDKL